ncbi:hypothetical protein HYALB_00010823 [Hymenoscyphus albidus]|uniref:Aminoglycoside phosphotransferase domain-containing protein n=1 Tax=Hymenoscyphus albidus TaxID=595503 RepID=A0A9N9Q2S7_9HELO|nr:hypothetical protein HYALB_00010823 [Hymenoscyphus albidus]
MLVDGSNARQPRCVPIPHGTKELIFRLANPDAVQGMNPATRIENEVAIIALASAALKHIHPRIVPSVYGWGSAALQSSPGWIIQELMPGTPVDESFDDMSLEKKRSILEQMGRILKSLQDYELPPSITGYGGVTFDETGRKISAAMTSVGAGPWDSYEASFEGRLRVALRKANQNPYIQGWRANGLRERLDAFVKRGVPALFEALGSKHDRVIIHADFSNSSLKWLSGDSANNLLFDARTGSITALIDYDFACISHPSYEFFRSFDGTGGQFRGWIGDEATEDMLLREAKIHGFPVPLPPTTEHGVQWEVVAAWEEELERLGVKRLQSMPGIEKVADVDTILRCILPWRVSNLDVLRLQSEAVIMRCRNDNERQLVRLLSRTGF